MSTVICLSRFGMSFNMPPCCKSGCCVRGKWHVQFPRTIPLLVACWFCKISSSTNVHSWYVRPAIATLHHLLARCTLIAPSLYWWWISMEKICFSHKIESYCILLCKIKFPVLPLHISLSPEHHLSDACSVSCMLPLLQVQTPEKS